MTPNAKTGITLAALCAAFSALTVGFLSGSGEAEWSAPRDPAGGHKFS